MIRALGTANPEPPIILDPESARALSHDDGRADGRRSIAGEGHAVLFASPSGEWYLGKVSIHGSLYGAGYDPARTFFFLSACDPRMEVVARSAHPYALFERGEEKWGEIDVPPVRVAGRFCILALFHPTETKGVYVSIDRSMASTSMDALPEKPGKALSGESRMLRATLYRRAKGKPAAKRDVPREGPTGIDAMAIAEARARYDALEEEEDAAGMTRLAADLAKKAPEAAADLGAAIATAHVLVRYANVPEEYARAVAALYEACDAALRKRFGFDGGVSPIPGKRLHVHLTRRRDRSSPSGHRPGRRSSRSSSIRCPPGSEGSPPRRRGGHIVYGLCRELGHILAGFEDDRHPWAHYLGSMLVDEVVVALGEKTWPQPYDHRAEGMARSLAEIERAEPDRSSDAGLARILYDAGRAFGPSIRGKAIAWVKANQPGEPFHAPRLYRLDDLRDASIELGCDPAAVRKLFKA